MSNITWFKSSPSAGDPSCLCSWCEQPIGEEEAPIIRMFDTDTNREARFHRKCASASGLLPEVKFFDVEFFEDEL
jgi:hypothetical protein